MRVLLKARILGSVFGSQRRFGAAVDIAENRLSMIVQGWIDPTEAERASICDELNVVDPAAADALFENGRRQGVEYADVDHRGQRVVR